MRRSFLSCFFRTDQAAIAPLYAFALFALVGMAGIGFDYARLVSLDSELQNAADQAALAAATQLDKEPTAIARAIGAAQGGLVANETLLANDGGARAVAVPTVTFFTTRADAELNVNGYNAIDDPARDASAAFVRVAVEMRTANYALTPIVGALSGTIDAKAVAGMGSALCRSPPLMMCNPNEDEDGDKDADFNADAYAGYGLLLKGGGGKSWAPGNFGFLDTGPENGVPALLKALGWSDSPNNCVAQAGADNVDTETGNKTSASKALNTRFDMYDGGACPSGGGTCPASINSRKDVMRPANANSGKGCEFDKTGWQEPASGKYLPTSATVPLPITTILTSMGHPRDMCHAVASDPVAPCSGHIGNGLWDRDAYFRSHYLRTSAGAGGAIGTRWTAARWWVNTGLASNATTALDVSRYEVYLWEIEHRGQTIDGVVILGKDPPSASGSTLVKHGTPVCSGLKSYGSGTVPDDTTGDRRRVTVAVINCVGEEVKGSSTDVPVRRWMNVFLVQPSLKRDRTGTDEIYVEIIGETTGGSSGETAGQVVRRDVPILIR